MYTVHTYTHAHTHLIHVCSVNVPDPHVDGKERGGGDIFQEHVIKRTLYSEKKYESLNVEYFLAMNIQNLDKNG